MNCDVMFKVIVIGETGVGKSSLLKYLIDGEFSEDHNVTIGVEFGNYVIRLNKSHTI